MTGGKVALAVGAHADDVEFGMAGTLSLLSKVGFEPHIMTITFCDLDSNEMTREKIAQIRDKEARSSAAVIGAKYHPPIVPDVMVFYEDKLIRRVAAVIREVQPRIILLPSLSDYMEDHMITARLVLTACFVRGMRNYLTDPPRDMTNQDVYLYHAQPVQNLDPLGQFVIPDLFVDITSEMETKLKMLKCYESQWKWLKDTQGMDNFQENARTRSKELAQHAPRKVEYVEGFRKHSYMGYSADDEDLLSRALGEKVMKKH